MISTLSEFLPFQDALLYAVRKCIKPGALVELSLDSERSHITFEADGVSSAIRISGLKEYLKTQKAIDDQAEILAQTLVVLWAEKRYLQSHAKPMIDFGH